MSKDEVVCGRNCSCCEFGDGTAPCDHGPTCRTFTIGLCDCDADARAKKRKAESEEPAKSIIDLKEIEELLAQQPEQPPWKAIAMSESGHRAQSWTRVYVRDYRYFDIDFSLDAKLIVALRNAAPELVKIVKRFHAAEASVGREAEWRLFHRDVVDVIKDAGDDTEKATSRERRLALYLGEALAALAAARGST